MIITTQEELDAIQRLLSKSTKDLKTGCWNYTGLKDRKGYGKFSFKIYKSAHRASYFIFKGTIKKGLDVAHDCDNKSCINPRHLRLLSRKDNMKDAVIRGRIKTGYAHKQAKLSKIQRVECHRLRLAGWSFEQIANKFLVSRETVRRNLRSFLLEVTRGK